MTPLALFILGLLCGFALVLVVGYVLLCLVVLRGLNDLPW